MDEVLRRAVRYQQAKHLIPPLRASGELGREVIGRVREWQQVESKCKVRPQVATMPRRGLAAGRARFLDSPRYISTFPLSKS